MSRKHTRKRVPRPAPEPVISPRKISASRSTRVPGRRRIGPIGVTRFLTQPLTGRPLIAASLVIGLALMLAPILSVLLRPGRPPALPLLFVLMTLGGLGTMLVYNAIRSMVLGAQPRTPAIGHGRRRR